MHAHTPPFTKPEGAYDSRRLREETIAIAVAQDAKLALTDDEREAKLRTAKHYIYHAKLLMDEVFGSSSEFPAPAARNIPRSAKQAVCDMTTVAQARGEYGDGVPSRHPMHAEALRAADERPGDLL